MFGSAGYGQVSVSGVDPALAACEQRVEAALASVGSVDFVECTLIQVAESLSRQFGIPILLVQKKLEEASVSPDTPITKTLLRLPLESILHLLLDELELTFTVRDGVLQITTPEDAESKLITRVYPVLDLVTNRHDTRPEYGDYDGLIHMITHTLAPDLWDDVGGPASIDCFSNSAALVVSQTRDVHRQIEELLIALRRAKSVQGIPAPLATHSAPERISARPTIAKTTRHPPALLHTWQLPQVHAPNGR